MQTILNKLVYFGFFQSLFLLIVYLFSSKSRKNSNNYLIILIVILFIGLLGRVIYLSDMFENNFRLIAFSEFGATMFGTTAYLFTRSSLLGKKPSKADFVHYIPSVGYILFIIFYFMLASDAVISDRIKTGELSLVIYLCLSVVLILNCCYWSLSLYEYLKFKNQLKDELSYVVKTKFFLNFHIAIGVCLLSWIAIYGISLFGSQTLERELRPMIWLSLAFIILFIAYYGLLVPEVFKLKPLAEVKKYAQSKFSVKELNQLKVQLDTIMEEKKPYLNQKLLKAELAEMLGVSNPELARLLNEKIGMNFFEYVNYHRIKEFVVLAQSEKAKQLTFFGLAQEAGFNSKTTFNKSFKKLMGTSPSEYFSTKR